MRRRLGLLIGILALLLPAVLPVSAASSGGPRAYLIGAASPLTARQVEQLKAAGAQVTHVYRNFGGAAAVIGDKDVARVRALPFVTSVNEDTLKQPDAVAVAGVPSGMAGVTGASTLPGTPYWLDLIDAEATTTWDGTGVWVAVLDTGFYPNWRDYFNEESILTEYASAFVAALGNPNENQWDVGSDPHGMAVSATIVGHWFRDKPGEGGFGQGYATGAAGTYWVPGVAEGAKIIPIKVCEPIGCFGSAINAGVDYITSLKKANPSQPIVINMSLGGPNLDPTEKAALDAAIAAGVVVVASAGNSGNAGMGFPSAYEPVVSVGAGGWVDQWNEWPDNTWWLDDVPEDDTIGEVYVAGFSSREKPGQYLDVVSTGRYLLLPYPCAQLYKDGQVTNGTIHRTCASKATPDSAQSAPFQYLFISGTSFSAPTMAGIVALMLQQNPHLTNADATFGTLDPATWGPGSLERVLEEAATPIPPGEVTVVHRDGTPLSEAWGADATGYGWVFVDDALAAGSSGATATAVKGKGR